MNAAPASIVPPSGFTPWPPPNIPSPGGCCGAGPGPLPRVGIAGPAAGIAAAGAAKYGAGAKPPSAGFGADPALGGATPTIVPLSLFGMGRGADAGRGGEDPGRGSGGGGALRRCAPVGGAAAGAAPPVAGELIISIVPLNFGALAPFRLKLHLVQTWTVSGFWVPQFGQNKVSSFQSENVGRGVRRSIWAPSAPLKEKEHPAHAGAVQVDLDTPAASPLASRCRSSRKILRFAALVAAGS